MYTKIVLKIVYTQIHGKFNIVPFHEKGQLQASLTAFCEKILFNSIFECIQESSLLLDNQSSFGPSDSCEFQLLWIVPDIYGLFDCNPPKDVPGIF